MAAVWSPLPVLIGISEITRTEDPFSILDLLPYLGCCRY
jgi:hypothetical protein